MQRSNTTRRKIYDRLKEEIFACEILPEEVLVVDRLADRFEVSRTPVREALMTLCGEGLLQARHHVGFIVSSVNPREIIETYSLRALLEKESARMAASRIDEESLLELEEYVRKPRRQQRRRFHSIISVASGWSILAETIEGLLDRSARAHSLFMHAHDLVSDEAFRSIHGHAEIYEAVRARDADRAATAMVLHLNEAKERVLRAISMI